MQNKCSCPRCRRKRNDVITIKCECGCGESFGCCLNKKALKGTRGLISPAGPVGETGATGATGVTGATGAAGIGLMEYGYFYSSTAQTISNKADVIFDSNGIYTQGFSHIPNTSEITVFIQGDYEISYILSVVEPNQFIIYLNGLPVKNTIYSSAAGTQQNTGQSILTLSKGDVLTLRNESLTTVTLQTPRGIISPNVNASMILKKLN